MVHCCFPCYYKTSFNVVKLKRSWVYGFNVFFTVTAWLFWLLLAIPGQSMNMCSFGCALWSQKRHRSVEEYPSLRRWHRSLQWLVLMPISCRNLFLGRATSFLNRFVSNSSRNNFVCRSPGICCQWCYLLALFFFVALLTKCGNLRTAPALSV